MTAARRGQQSGHVPVNNLPQYLTSFIGRAGEKFDAEGRLTDEESRRHIAKLLEALAAWTRRLRGEG